MSKKNIILSTDSYKIGAHHNMYPPGTRGIYSYLEARNTARWDETVFFGLQYILKNMFLGRVVTQEKIDEAETLCLAHLGPGAFNKAGWEHILNKHDGRLPVMIKAVPEGMVVPKDNVMLTILNTDKECEWLTSYLETLLSQVWYPSTVATLSREVKRILKAYLGMTSDDVSSLLFKLHDFGARGVSTMSGAEIGGLAHLVNFMGTDTLAAIVCARDYYNAPRDFSDIAFSVPATEHSIMTSYGREGEIRLLGEILAKYPAGILSVVGDSYDIYRFVDEYMGKIYKEQILKRDGVFVVRPDSISPEHRTPGEQVLWILQSLYHNFGGEINSKGYKVLNPKVRVLWGDGLSIDSISETLAFVELNKFSTDNIATFGMGGGLLQDVNRDVQRFAFKCSSQLRDGTWHDIRKQPRDVYKASKAGRLKLIKVGEEFKTVLISEEGEDLLETVFVDGQLIRDENFTDVRKRAEL